MSGEAPSTGSGQAPSTSAGGGPASGGGSGQVLYRKWRPQTFAEVVGQEPVTRTLRNSVAAARLAHAYLLCGPRGTGKTSLGRLIAKAANCAATLEGEPCNQCDSCRAFLEGRAMDFIEQDAASHNSVDDIRQLRENVVLNPMSGRYKVYLLDEVHMLSKGAENALLKTLEEPPPHIIFVLATTEPHKVEATVISRCQRFDLRRIPLPAAAALLARICQGEGYSLDEASLAEIARGATGSLRDAINALEQVVTYYGPSPGFEQVQEALGLRVDVRSGELARCALAGELPEGLKLIAAVRDDGVEMRQFSRQVVRYLRGLLLAKAGAEEALDLPREAAAAVREFAQQVESAEIVRALRTFGRVDFREDPQSSLPLELALVEFVSAAREVAPETKAEPVGASKGEPHFSIPVAETEAVASTAASASLEPAPAEPAAGEAGLGVAPSTLRQGSGQSAFGGSGQELVERVRLTCKETDKQLAALLNGSCEVKSMEGDVLTLGFYHTFHLERIESGRYARRLEELFGMVLGRPLKVAYVHSPRAPTPGRITGGHLVQAAQELGAKPIEGKGGKGGATRDEP